MKLRRLIKPRGMVRDARGRRVPAVTAKEIARTDGKGVDDRRRTVAKSIRKMHRDIAWSIAGANVVWLFVIAAVWNRFEDKIIGRHAFQDWPRLGALILLIAIVAIVCLWLAKGRSARRRADIAVAEGFCGSCGYDLQGLTSSKKQRLVTCPECGSVWRR